MKNLFLILFTLLFVGCSSKPVTVPVKPELPRFAIHGMFWELSVAGEANWHRDFSDYKGFILSHPETDTKAMFDTLDEPGLSLDDATKLMILQLMLQGAEEVKFSTVKAAGREGSEMLATKDKAAIWAWVWVNGNKVHALMCGSKQTTPKAEELCRGLVAGLVIKAAATHE